MRVRVALPWLDLGEVGSEVELPEVVLDVLPQAPGEVVVSGNIIINSEP